MSSCCDKTCETEALQSQQSSTLQIVLGLNLIMFFVEGGFGLLAHSTALLGDSLDMLGDALAYGMSLYAVTRPAYKLPAARFKAGIMVVFGVLVLGEALWKVLVPVLPAAHLMGGIGFLALLVNSLCLALLWRHRTEDLNMRSVWLCSRNDIIANTSVLAAAGLVWLSATRWADILVGVGIALLFLHSAWSIFQEAAAESATLASRAENKTMLFQN